MLEKKMPANYRHKLNAYLQTSMFVNKHLLEYMHLSVIVFSLQPENWVWVKCVSWFSQVSLENKLCYRKPKVGEAHVRLEVRKGSLCTNTAFSFTVTMPVSEILAFWVTELISDQLVRTCSCLGWTHWIIEGQSEGWCVKMSKCLLHCADQIWYCKYC